MASQHGEQTIAIHILLSISRSNFAMKFGHLEYNMRKIFLEKSYANCGGETISRPFFKNSNLSMSLNQVLV